jgi:hypothetical protein
MFCFLRNNILKLAFSFQQKKVNFHFELLSSTPFLSQVINGGSAKKGEKYQL